MIFIARMCRFLSLSICSSLLCLPLIGFANLSLSERLADLKARSSQHEDQVSVILGKSNLTPTNFETAVPVIIPEEITPPAETPAPPYIPIPEYYDSSESDVVREVPASSVPSVDDLVEDPNIIATPARDDDNQSKDDLEKAYDDLYEEDRVERHIGYYFGPIFSIAIPDDGAVRVPGNAALKRHFDSDVGYLLGFQFGKDFGGSRFEAEYSYLNFDGSGILGKFENSSHNLLLRLLLEYEMGELIDFRTGLGMGVAFPNFDHDRDYSGTGFAYDFVLGLGYKVTENLSLQVDYRYFLTAAGDEFDRIKSHMILIGANLDL